MKRNSTLIGATLAVALGLSVSSAKAASLQQVSGWGTGYPSDVSMYAYVPDKVAQKPPVVLLVHYCGGTAQAVFGQAGGIVKAADQYGFIMVVPSSGRCWDVVSDQTRTRDSKADSGAMRQMVKYAIEKYSANPERVYVTGDSSGGMTTELMLALYPDVFKAGAAFAGMPAGCGTGTSGYSGACAGGSVTHTAMEWGDIVRKFDAGYTGHRPRVQLFHGDADNTISFKNHAEAIKEWTNVLGLPEMPTSTQMNVKLGNHQSTRQSWKNACGYVVVDAFTSIGGDHGPSDALFQPEFVVPFLGLDKTGEVDPEIEQCKNSMGGGGMGGSGGAAGTGGMSAAGTGGTGGASAGGTGGMSAGGTANGGAAGQVSGGMPGAAGAVTTGGMVSAGGTSSVAGTSSAGTATTPPGDGSTSSSCSLGGAASDTSLMSSLSGLVLGLGIWLRRRKA